MNKPLFIQWRECNEVGVPIIDEQHKGIVSVVNTFYHLMGTDTNDKALSSCISDTMKNYSKLHFITEEEILEKAGYKGLEEHKKLHPDLIREIEIIELRYIKTNDIKPLLDFLKKWWLEHINVQDQLFTPHLRGQK